MCKYFNKLWRHRRTNSKSLDVNLTVWSQLKFKTPHGLQLIKTERSNFKWVRLIWIVIIFAHSSIYLAGQLKLFVLYQITLRWTVFCRPCYLKRGSVDVKIITRTYLYIRIKQFTINETNLIYNKKNYKKKLLCHILFRLSLPTPEISWGSRNTWNMQTSSNFPKKAKIINCNDSEWFNNTF